MLPLLPTVARCKSTLFISAVITLILLAAVASAQTEPTDGDSTKIEADSVTVAVAPVTSLIASDHKYDAGEQIDLSWVPSIDDRLVDGKVTGYSVFRIIEGGEPEIIAELAPGSNSYNDRDLESGTEYSYYVVALSESSLAMSVSTAQIAPKPEWLNLSRGYLFLIALFISAAVIYFVESAKRGKKLFVRRIAGLEAIDDAVGRATEMGRPVLFIPGISDMDDVQTLAALTILGRVSRTIADYDTKIFMPVARSLVMTAARETIKTSYQAAGHPDAYSDDMVNYVTDEQFGYVAAVDGLMVREKPATVFLLGAFFAESLILAETGNSIGAIQIAGTARPAQLPFFIAACDFTLIGEELFAASAYLSGEPRMLGSLKGQDVGKAIAVAAIFLGVLTITIAEAWDSESMQAVYDWLSEIFSSN
ncbi:MAG: fibronectin type III domain-containing protein [bacterium]